MLTRVEKEALVSDLKGKIEKANALFLTNLVGAKSNDSNAIRKEVRDAEGTIVVTKNSLFRLASEGTYAEELLKNLKGTNAVALAFGEAPAVAKALDDASKDNDAVTLGAGFLRDKALTEAEVVALAKLPSRDQMLATLLATFNAPVSAFVRVMDAIRVQKGEGAPAVEAKAEEAAPTEEVAAEPEAKTEVDEA